MRTEPSSSRLESLLSRYLGLKKYAGVDVAGYRDAIQSPKQNLDRQMVLAIMVVRLRVTRTKDRTGVSSAKVLILNRAKLDPTREAPSPHRNHPHTRNQPTHSNHPPTHTHPPPLPLPRRKSRPPSNKRSVRVVGIFGRAPGQGRTVARSCHEPNHGLRWRSPIKASTWVGRRGLEPRTYGLKVHSSAELS